MHDFERKTIFLYQHTRSGRSHIVPCETGLMTIADHREAERLHLEVSRGISPDIFAPTSPEDLVRLLGPDGVAAGVWHANRLVAMRAIQTDKDWVGEVLLKMGLPLDEAGRTTFTEHCIVDKEFRGNNIQFLSHYDIETRIAGYFDRIVTTVSPKNVYSLRNVFACNFLIVAMRELYGGYMRCILEKNFISPMSIWTNGDLVVPLKDVNQQRFLLAEGYVGYRLIRKSEKYHVLYAPSALSRPPADLRNKD